MKKMRFIIGLFDVSILVGISFLLVSLNSAWVSKDTNRKKIVSVIARDNSEQKIDSLILKDNELTAAFKKDYSAIYQKKTIFEIINIQKSQIDILKEKIKKCEGNYDSLILVNNDRNKHRKLY